MKGFLLILIFCVSSAHAVEAKFAKRAKDGTSVFNITGRIEQSQSFPRIVFTNRTRFVISSSGGVPHGVESLANWLDQQIWRLGGRPQVIVRTQCSSSCLMLLAHLNYLDRQGMISLILDEDLALGFHGCMNSGTNRYSKKCTTSMAEYQLNHGVRFDWMMENIELFARPNPDYLVRVPVTDERLKGSGLIDYAQIRKNTYQLIAP